MKTLISVLRKALAGIVVYLVLSSTIGPVLAQQEKSSAQQKPSGSLQTIQDYIEGLRGPKSVELDDAMSVFRFVFENLLKEVKVYPTEDYFYFSFNKDGVGVSGNIRLAIETRDKGNFHFVYFSTHANFSGEKFSGYKLLGKEEGLILRKVARLQYDMTFEGRTVRFLLNDLSKVEPPKSIVHDHETYIGPVFDESGVQLYLLYNREQKVFHYVLNEKALPSDRYAADPNRPQLWIGHRTDFVFIRDPMKDRFILAGVNNENTVRNNYFDGPFDQLPDNYVKGETLRDALIDSEPDYKGKIDRLGGFGGGESRVVIGPYIQYTTLDDFQPMLDCLAKVDAAKPKSAYLCFDQRTLN